MGLVSICEHVQREFSRESDRPGIWFIISEKDRLLLNDCMTSADAVDITHKPYK